MPATVVVGAQYGGEGKGKTVAYLSKHLNPEIVIRCGGPNSGHTVSIDGEATVLRMVPTGYVNKSVRLLLAPGTLIDPSVLLEEIAHLGLAPNRIGVDRRATIIEASDHDAERSLGLEKRLGSTLCGVGVSVSRRALRDPNLKHAADMNELRPFLCDASAEIHRALNVGRRVIIEGTQGFGLSLYHGGPYPYMTSRDTTAAAFMSEVGIGPREVDQVLVVTRTYPIRVGGNSGPLQGETSWDAIRDSCGSPESLEELTTVTRRVRRVGTFDPDMVNRAASYNGATGLVVNGLDLLDYRNRGIHAASRLTHKARAFLETLELQTGVRVLLGGTGPGNSDFVSWFMPSTEAETRIGTGAIQ